MSEKYSAPSRPQKRLRAAALLSLAALGLLGSAFLLCACVRKGRAPASATPVGETATLPAAVSPSTPPVADSARGEAAKSSGTAPELSLKAKRQDFKPVILAASLRGFGLGVPSSPRMPEDFSLGPLQSYAPVEGSDESAVLAVARKFMDTIAQGKLDTSLLLPDARGALSVLLEPPAQVTPPAQDAPPAKTKGGGGPAVKAGVAHGKDADAAKAEPPGSADLRYRLGAISINGDDASLALRMPRENGESPRSEGLLSFRKSGGSWYVQALALKPPETAALAFVPGSSN